MGTSTGLIQVPINNVVIVQKEPGGNEYSSIAAALASIVGASPTNPFTIQVGPGVYTEPLLIVPPFVSIVGNAILSTIIEPDTSFHDVMQISAFSEISFLTINDAGAGYAGLAMIDTGYFGQAHKLIFNNCDIAIHIKSITQETVFNGEFIDINGVYSIGCKVEALGGFGAFVNLQNYYNVPYSGVSIIGTYVTGIGAYCHIMSTGALMLNGIVGLGTAFYVQDGGNLNVTSGSVIGFNKTIFVGNVGAPSAIYIDGVVAQGTVTYDLEIAHPGTIGTVNGVFNDTLYINASTGVAIVIQDTNNNSLSISNLLEIIFNNGTKTNISSLIVEDATCGVEEGGDLSNGGGFVVNILAGFGYFEQFPDNDVIDRHDWNNTSITLSANVDVYIYFNNSKILTSNGAEPDTRYNILLGRVVTNATGIEIIDDSPSDAEHTGNLLSQALKNAIGPVYASGSIVTENPTPRQLNINSGQYYYGENVFVPTGGTALTFTAVYGQGAGMIPAQTVVSNTQYDNAGTLTALTASYYAKHSVYIVGAGANEKYYVVYAQNEYSTLLAAQQSNIPLPPAWFKGSVSLIAGLIVQQGATNLVQIIDQRPIVGFRASGVNASADHLSLLNLNGGVNGDGGHTNLMTVNGSKPMTGNLDMGGNTINNVVGNALTKTDDTNVTISLSGNPTDGLLKSILLTMGWTGLLSIARGGTNISTYATGDILYASAANVLSKLPAGTAGQVLTIVAGIPAWVTDTDTGGTVTSISGVAANGFTWVITNPTTTPSITLLLQNATTAQSGQLTSTDWNTFNTKEPAISAGTTLQYWRGDKTFQTLNTLAVPELTNLYFTTGRVDTRVQAYTGDVTLVGTAFAIGALKVLNSMIANGTIDLTTKVTGILPVANGGTNIASYTIGDLLYASGATTLSKLADIATGNALLSGGVGVAPSWGKIGLTTHVSGILPIANGGTNQSTYVTGDMLYASAVNVLSKRAIGTAGQSLTPVAGVPTWVTKAAIQSSPADPATTVSTVGVMMGLGASITPTKSGTVLIIISGDMDNSTNGVANGCQVQMRTNTGAAPVNGAALTGTTRGALVKYLSDVNGNSITRVPFTLNCVITGLTVGTAIWIDISLALLGTGTARVRDISISAVEQ